MGDGTDGVLIQGPGSGGDGTDGVLIGGDVEGTDAR
jgi:hypothetical protein